MIRSFVIAISTLLLTLGASPARAQKEPSIVFQNGQHPAVIFNRYEQWSVQLPLAGTDGRDMETVELAFENYFDANRNDPEILLKGVRFLARQTVKWSDLGELVGLTFVLFQDGGDIDLGRATLEMIEANDFRTPAAMGILGMILCSHSSDDVRLDAAERIARTRGSLSKQEFSPSILARPYLDGHATRDLYEIWVLTGLAYGEIGRERAAAFLSGGRLAIGEIEALTRFAAENHHPSSRTRNLLEEVALRYILEEGLHDWPKGDIRITYSEYRGFETWYLPNFTRVLDGRTEGPEAVRLMSLLALFRMKEALPTIRDGLTQTNLALQGGAFEAAIRSFLWGKVLRSNGELSDLDPSVLIQKGAWISTKRVFSRYFKAALTVIHYPTDPEPPRVYWPVRQVVESVRLSPEQKTELLSEFLRLSKEAGTIDILLPLTRLDVAASMVGNSEGVRAFTEIVLDDRFETRLLESYSRTAAAELEQRSLALIVELGELKSKPAADALVQLEMKGWVEPAEPRSSLFRSVREVWPKSATGKGPLMGDPLSKELRETIVKKVKARIRDGFRL